MVMVMLFLVITVSVIGCNSTKRDTAFVAIVRNVTQRSDVYLLH